MHLAELSWDAFRNLEPRTLVLGSGFNVIEGENGQGKTNLLEAVYWLSTLRPLRAGRLTELVRFGADACRVEVVVEREGLLHRLEARIEKGERTCRRERKLCKPPEFFGVLAVVLFTPDDVGLLRDPPQERRRFLDRAIFTGRPAHLSDVQAYRRALEARNEALRTQGDPLVLEAFEEALSALSVRLVAARETFVEQLRPFFLDAFAGIAGPGMRATLEYRPSLASREPADHAAAWAADRERDRQRGFTARGPHADDLGVALAGRSARLYASQGQQRALVLALKIAEIRLLEALFGLTPILLLDDVSSELDAQRNARLFELLHGFRGQVLITTTDARHVRTPAAARGFHVEAGQVSPDPDVAGDGRK